jgi:GT2 family glycosyltransferase
VNYRGAADTAACIRSLLASAAPAAIVLVDTSPNDPELESAIAFAPGVKLLRPPENLGFGGGNNLGIEWALKSADCEYIFLLNNDAVVLPDTISELESAMQLDPSIGICAPRIAFMDRPDRLWYGGGAIDWRRSSAFTPGFGGDAEAPLAMMERDVTFATGCALFLRRSAAEKLEGFDPRFFMYEEDVELCLRAREHRIRIRYIPRCLIFHRAQGSTRKTSGEWDDFWSVRNPRLPFYAFHVLRNRALNIYLHARGWDWITARFFFLSFWCAALSRSCGEDVSTLC